ncbi:DUF6493 family protein [Actinomadura sp. WAC 06369]|uniref:DUF6493 family protein n=1 Tax=Actinomadura sp. WAC 06369 TaxID=2203193 RepID=UPI000F766B94|nr:DUF6493 family protein [Actinomadura sp. WAC 06369]RSN68500.1 hypothetical protein DMH08_10850 [Actinomadura sp. WAC 06369]
MTSVAHPPDAAAAWSRIADLIDARDADGVAAAVLDLDDGGRRAVAAALPGHLREVRARREPWEGIGDALWAFRAAGAGTLGGAAAVASWLNRREFRDRWLGDPDDDGRLLDLWAERDDAWRADLARRLALRVRGPRHTGIGLALALLRETGAEPPDHAPLVVGWVLSGPPRPKDPLLPALLPRVFEADGVGRALRESRTWPRTLATMAARGDADRDALLDGCVRRFLRGGTEVELRFFVRLHHLLTHDEPSARRRETAARVRDYAALLAAAPGPVAALALDLLREVPDLPAARLAEAFDGLLFRPEAGLVRTGLAWLRETVRDRPETADAGARALAQVFGHESYAVQEKAVRLALALPGGTDGAPLADAAPLLPPDLGARVAARFGGEAAAEAEADDDPAPPVLTAAALDPEPSAHREPRPLPDPIATPSELASAIAGSDGNVERLLEGFVRLAHADPDGVRAAVEGVLERLAWPHFRERRTWCYTHEWTNAAARMLVDPASVPADWRDRMAVAPDGPLGALELHRAAEILGAVEAGALPPLLLATPTEPSGHVAPDVLADRLRTVADAGAEPGPADLQQALLRLPPGPHPEASRRAAAVGTPAARTAARWLAAPPVPRVSLREKDGRLPEAAIDLDVLDGPLADPGLDTTFPFPDDADDPTELPPGVWTVTGEEAAPARGGGVSVPGMVRFVMSSPALSAMSSAEDRTGDAPDADVRPAFADRSDPRAPGRGVAPPEGVTRPVEGRVVARASVRSMWRSRRGRLGLVDGGPTGLPLVDAVFSTPSQYPSHYGDRGVGWARVIPSHPEAAAAYLVPEMRGRGYYSARRDGPAAALLELVPADGMYADHIADFLARRLAERHRRPDRMFLGLCARGDLPAAAVGRAVARLLLDGDVRPSRVTGELERAAEAGAFADVWRVLAAALPPLCPAPGERAVHGLDRLLSLAARTARWCGARGAIPGVEALAARPGSAAYVRAARVLAGQLAS